MLEFHKTSLSEDLSLTKLELRAELHEVSIHATLVMLILEQSSQRHTVLSNDINYCFSM